MGAHCMVTEPDGSVRLNDHGKPSITTFLFPRSKVTLLDTWDTLGLGGTASDSYRVDEVFVSEAFTGTRENPENRRVAGLLFWFTQQGLYAVGVAGVALGIATAMLDALHSLAKSKTPRGLSRLAEQTAVRSLVARSEAQLGAARAYLLNVIDTQFASAQAWGATPIPERARLRLATTYAITSAVEVTDRMHKAAGVFAIFRGSGPFEGRFRDMHTLSQQIQSRDAHFETVGDEPLAFL
jgi:alkylation response protein AidB-like acyl-CoA dehydrogenase